MKQKIAAFLCVVMCLTSLVVPTAATSERDISEHETCAVILKQLGLFKGVSDTDFDLDRAPTRIEALVMLIRVLGKEHESLQGKRQHPFTDVPVWDDDNANRYVGYAYFNKLTNGMDEAAGIFGSYTNANAQMYLTFVLRALGYSDKDGADFTYDDPFTLAKKVGILNDAIDVDNFLRADVAAISYLALEAKLKGSEDTLAKKLIEAGVFTLEQYCEAMGFDMPEPEETDPPEVTVPEVSPEVKLTEYIKEKGKYSSGKGTYKLNKTVDGVDYSVIYNERTGNMQLSTHETIPATTEVPLETTVDATVNFTQSGDTFVVFILKMGDYQFKYEANIDRKTFSRDTVLTPRTYTGPVELKEDTHEIVIRQTIKTLIYCEEYLFSESGVTLIDLGFEKFAN